MNVLASIAVLGFLILFHESGHFLAAISQRIRVNGFSIGFGPALIQKQINGVTFAIRALPLGGFVSFPDVGKGSNIPADDPDLLQNRPIAQRALVISAGVIANLLLAWILLAGQASLIGIPNQPDPGVLIMSVQQGEAADIAGLSPGDRIVSISGKSLGTDQEAVKLFINKVQNAPEEKILIERIREDKQETISIKPSNNLGNGKIGAQLQPNFTNEIHPAKNISEIITHADTQFIDFLTRTINGYKGLVTDFGATSQQLSGPVKIVEIGAHLSEQGGSGLILFAALISINLAVLNSLPLPLLDGGQLALLLFEGVRGRPVPEPIQQAIVQSGFLLIVGLSVVLIIRDTTQLNMFQQLISH